MLKKMASYETVGDSCENCGNNFVEIQDGPHKGILICVNMNCPGLGGDDYTQELIEWLEYEIESD